MENSKINNENYIQIQGWMIKQLKLKGNELLIYAIIYGFSQDGVSKYKGGLQYLAEWTNSTKQGCMKNLSSLVDKEYIIKEEKIVNNVKYCNYVANIEKVNTIKQSLPPIKQSLIPGKQSLPNNIINNKKENITTKEYIVAQQNFLSNKIYNIINYLNEVAGTKFKPTGKNTIQLIKARLKEGYTEEDFYKVIDNKWADWQKTEFQQYMRPSTLFGNKFENYLNSVIVKKTSKGYCDNTAGNFTGNNKITDQEFMEMPFATKKEYIGNMALADMTPMQQQFFTDHCLARDENGKLLQF